MVLVTTYYKEVKVERAKEYAHCLNNNLSNPLIDKVIILAEDPCNIEHEKLTIINHDRPTIGQMYNIGKPHGDIIIVANADICFDDTLKLVDRMDNEVWALSRINVIGNKRIPYYNSDSQDVWIFKGIGDIEDGICTIGKPGCDNRFVYDMQVKGIKISNPCKSINALHYHYSNIRNYTSKDTIPPPHKTIHPCSL